MIALRFQKIALTGLIALFCVCDGIVFGSQTNGDPTAGSRVRSDTANTAAAPPVRALRLDNTETDDEELKKICAQHPELVELTLGGTKVTDAGLNHLTQLPRLRVIRLSRTAITDEGMSILAKCETLESIDVSQTNIGDKGVKALKTLPRLRILNLYMTFVTDKGLASFQDEEHRSAARIEQLNLDRAPITDEGISKLAALTNLAWLHLGATAITDTALVELAKFESLKETVVTRTETTVEGVEKLRRDRPDMTVRDNVSENVSAEAIEEAAEYRRNLSKKLLRRNPVETPQNPDS